MGKSIILFTAFGVVFLMFLMLFHILSESLLAFTEIGIHMFLPDAQWRPVSENPQYGLMPVIAGTLYVSGLAVSAALVFGIGCAVFLSFYVPNTWCSHVSNIIQKLSFYVCSI